MRGAFPVLLSMALATGAAAETSSLPMVEDLDLSGDWSLAELQAVWPELTKEGFTAMDANGDGAVDVGELQTAWDNALLKPPAEGEG